MLPAPVVGVIVGRDVLLVSGGFVARAKSLGWRWPGWSEFFRLQPPSEGAAAGDGNGPAAAGGEAPAGAAGQGGSGAGGSSATSGGPAARGPAPAAPLVRPLLISKVNTCFQLGLVGACMLDAWLGWPGPAAVDAGAAATAATTVASTLAYLRAYRAGTVLVATPGKGG